VPGTPLAPTRADARLPLLLIQRSIETAPPAPSGSSGAARPAGLPGAHGWTLLAPAGWGMPLLSALLHTGARFGGLAEQAQHALAAGAPAFPADAVGTPAYAAEAAEAGAKEWERWERTPKAKRVNYESRGVQQPWVPDWRALLGLAPITIEDEDPDLLPAQREVPADADPNAMDTDGAPRAASAVPRDSDSLFAEPWLLRGPQTPQTPTLLTTLASSPAASAPDALLAALDALRAKRALPPLAEDAGAVWRSALVRVRLKMCVRGKPGPGARVYALDDAEGRRWRAALARARGKTADAGSEEEGADEKAVSGHTCQFEPRMR
jgi:ribonuclease P/MRP protein subunit POP1